MATGEAEGIWGGLGLQDRLDLGLEPVPAGAHADEARRADDAAQAAKESAWRNAESVQHARWSRRLVPRGAPVGGAA